MPVFSLTWATDGPESPERIEFDSDDPNHAFTILAGQETGTPAILWQGDKRLGMIKRTQAGGWQLYR